MEPIQLQDFLSFHFLSTLKTNEGGDSLLYINKKSNIDTNQYDSDIEMIRQGKVLPLTHSKDISDYIFLGEQTIVFSSTRSKEEKERKEKGEIFTSFYQLSLYGGEAIKAFEIPFPVHKITKLSEETMLLQVSYDLRYGALLEEGKVEEVLNMKKDLAGHEVFTTIPFVSNGAGYTNTAITRLYTYHIPSKQLTALTPTDLNVYQYDVQKEQEKVLYIASQNQPRPTLKAGLWEVDIATNTTTTCIPEKEYSIVFAYYFQNNILFAANKETKHGNNENAKFFLYETEKETVRFLADPDLSLWNSVGSDSRLGGGNAQQVMDDTFYFLATQGVTCSLFSLQAEGDIKEVLRINGSIDCFTIHNDTVYFIGMQDSALQEVYQYNTTVAKLTTRNTSLENKYVATPQEVHFKNDDIDFTGWVLLPYQYDASKKYPAILDIHGGPKTVYGTVYYHEMQVWASMGYFVMFTNPRGSDGRGNAFMDIFGKYGTIDYEDLMTFTDVVCESYPSIDTTKLGVTGGSYGGYMTNWIITHTDRFASAATQRSISNWVSMYGTSDIGFHFVEDQIHGNVWDTPEKLWEHSPLKYIKNAKTPTLIIHSDEDYRCPEEQAMQLYTALVDLGVETRMVLFHGDNHELSRSGKPKNRVTRLQEITNWMETHLK